METLIKEQAKIPSEGCYGKTVDDIQRTIDLLESARASIAADPTSSPRVLAKLQNATKQSFEAIHTDLSEVLSKTKGYNKALDKKFKEKPLPAADYDALSSRSSLTNRAIGMHFLREGQFAVASTFLNELGNTTERDDADGDYPMNETTNAVDARLLDELKSEDLRKNFGDMYHILHEMKAQRNLAPAAAWAKAHSAELEKRGSNLEFELGRLQFIWLFENGADGPRRGYAAAPMIERQAAALSFARSHFGAFQERYLKEIQQLIGAMAFSPNLGSSPYRRFFHNESAWDNLVQSFTKEFCSLLGLSAESPVYIAATAGAIALPTLQKLETIMAVKRTEWTTQNELPAEIPLPPAFRFHSIFVCPVSKEQTTDSNPPMIMPCGHVIAKESLQRLAKSERVRFKCPYCPGESTIGDAKQVFL